MKWLRQEKLTDKTVVSSLLNNGTGTETEINYLILEWRVDLCYTNVVKGFFFRTFKDGSGTYM
jgi:hypothetical protein